MYETSLSLGPWLHTVTLPLTSSLVLKLLHNITNMTMHFDNSLCIADVCTGAFRTCTLENKLDQEG